MSDYSLSFLANVFFLLRPPKISVAPFLAWNAYFFDKFLASVFAAVASAFAFLAAFSFLMISACAASAFFSCSFLKEAS